MHGTHSVVVKNKSFSVDTVTYMLVIPRQSGKFCKNCIEVRNLRKLPHCFLQFYLNKGDYLYYLTYVRSTWKVNMGHYVNQKGRIIRINLGRNKLHALTQYRAQAPRCKMGYPLLGTTYHGCSEMSVRFT